MPVTLKLKFTKPDADTPSYINYEMGKKIREFQLAGKIIQEPEIIISDDGLIETRTIVYDSAGSANDFRLDEVAVENQQLRHEWCKTNNVKFSFTMDED